MMDTENIPLTIRYTYNKLVRDKIPENIDSKPGSKSKYRILNDNEYLIELNKKVLDHAGYFVSVLPFSQDVSDVCMTLTGIDLM